MKTNLIIAVMCLFALAASAKEIKTETFSVPLNCEKCVAKVEKNIAFKKGVKAIECDVEKNTVNVTYDTEKTNSEALIAAFAKIGKEATVKKGCCAKDKAECTKDKEACKKDKAECKDKACPPDCNKECCKDKAKCTNSKKKACCKRE